ESMSGSNILRIFRLGSRLSMKRQQPLIEEKMLKFFVQQKKSRLNRNNLLAIAKLLIKKEANPNAVHNSPVVGYTPLMLAVQLDEPELVQLMLEKGGNPYRTYQDGSYPIDCWMIARKFNARRALSVLGRKQRQY
ncbi:ankyrin repeat domain-containing protein, partial [Kistimonas scapharcae]|uniref:ankyrin repeat domain-containing protein n=1 Tax=Kistimonas scapharcae TaxID=1036133 RepID=UPI0031ECA9E0